MPFDPGAIADAAARGGGGGTSTQGVFSSGTGSAMDSQIPMVYMGSKKVERYYPGSFTAGNEQAGNVRSRIAKRDNLVPADEASASWYDMDAAERQEFAQYLVRIGVIDPEEADDFDALQAFWEKGIEISSGYTARGKDVTPEEALATWAGWDGSGESAAGRARAAAAAEAAPFTGSRTSRSESVNLSDPKAAKSLANYVVSKALGREALPEEMEAYRTALNSYEEANPQVSTTTATYKEGIQTDQSTVTKGGATAAGSEQVLTDMARDDTDYAEYQAAGPIWNAMLAALASPVQI